MGKVNKMKKDWSGNKKTVYAILGASDHSFEKREINDYYATHPIATKWLVDVENFNNNIWEPACGEGHISEILKSKGYNVKSSDKYDRGYGEIYDFLTPQNNYWNGDIVTNPPYKYAQEFVEKSLRIINENNKIAMFLKIQFLEGKKRKILFKQNPPIRVWVSSSRILCAKNGDFNSKKGSAVCYCWFIWKKGFKGDPIIKWFN